MNQNDIAKALRNKGMAEAEIERRLMIAKTSTSGNYNPLTDSYSGDEEKASEKALNEPQQPSNVPPLPPVGEDGLISEEEAQKKCGMFVVKSANQTLLDASLRPDPVKLWMGLWYEGEVCCLFADSFLGKSLYATQIGTSIATNHIVLYFDFELSDKMFQLRYTSDTGELYKFPENFYRVSVDPSQMNVGEDFESIVISNIEKTTIAMNSKVVIVDNLTWICQASEKAEVASALMKDLWGLSRKHGWSLLVISHTPKRNLSNPITQNDLSGSKKLFNFFDGCFAIGKSARGEDERYIKQLKVRSGLLEYHADNVLLCKIEKSGAFTQFNHVGFANEKELLKDNESADDKLLRDAIYELKDSGKTYQEIADQLGTNKSKVCRVLKKR